MEIVGIHFEAWHYLPHFILILFVVLAAILIHIYKSKRIVRSLVSAARQRVVLKRVSSNTKNVEVLFI